MKAMNLAKKSKEVTNLVNLVSFRSAVKIDDVVGKLVKAAKMGAKVGLVSMVKAAKKTVDILVKKPLLTFKDLICNLVVFQAAKKVSAKSANLDATKKVVGVRTMAKDLMEKTVNDN